MPVDKVVAAHAAKEMLLIIGMSMTAAWARWGSPGASGCTS